MAIYCYIITVETKPDTHPFVTGNRIQSEIDSNLESVITDLGIEHFTVEQAPVGYWPGQGFVESSLREGQADID